jgi:hypothetical protein
MTIRSAPARAMLLPFITLQVDKRKQYIYMTCPK